MARGSTTKNSTASTLSLLACAAASLACVIAAAVPPAFAATAPIYAEPTVTLYTNASNVFGRAQPRTDAGNVKYLGNETSVQGCQQACLAYKGEDGSECNSFSFHSVAFPDARFAGGCYGIVDHTWQLRDGSCPKVASCITTGRVERPLDGCGAGSPSGCEYLIDPVCLPTTDSPSSMTVAAAEAHCASTSSCFGCTF